MLATIEKIEDWAEARNLIRGSTPLKQVNKTSEEVNELVAALGVMKALADAPGLDDDNWIFHYGRAKEEAKDAIGDVVVTLVIIACQLGVPFEHCVDAAYEEIKDRRGKMINGIFVKEAP